MHALQRRLTPDGVASRNLLLSVLAVLAIVIGLFSMHSFTTAPEHSVGATSPVITTSTVDVSPLPDHGQNAADCTGGCGSEHAMTVMGCVLALLLLPLLFAVPLLRTRIAALARPLKLMQGNAGTVSVPPQPSLHALSISRT